MATAKFKVLKAAAILKLLENLGTKTHRFGNEYFSSSFHTISYTFSYFSELRHENRVGSEHSQPCWVPLETNQGSWRSALCTVWHRVIYRLYLTSFQNHSALHSNVPILQIKELKLRKMIKCVSQEYAVDNHTCLIPNFMLLHSVLQFVP